MDIASLSFIIVYQFILGDTDNMGIRVETFLIGLYTLLTLQGVNKIRVRCRCQACFHTRLLLTTKVSYVIMRHDKV